MHLDRRIPALTPVLSALLLACLLLGAAAEARADQRPVHLNVFFGISAAGRLYRAENPDPDYNWLPPDGQPFKAESVRVDLDENLSFGVRVGKGISQQFSVNLSAAFTDMTASAVALTEARNSDTYSWDSMTANLVDAAVVWDWSAESTTPYFLAGIGYASLGFRERDDAAHDLDQSGVQFVLGGGFRWNILQFEVRDHLVPVDLGPEERRLAVPIFEGKDLLHLWEITAGVSLNFGQAR